MLGKLAFSLTICAIIGFSQGSKLPFDIKVCSKSDPMFDTCLLNIAKSLIPKFKNGVPEIGVPSLNPLKVGDNKVQSDGGLLFQSLNGTISGLDKAKFEEFRINPEKKIMVLAFRSEKVHGKSKYKASGRILAFPVSGSGNHNAYFDNFFLKLKMNYVLKKDSSGNEYIHIKTAQSEYTVDKIQFKIDGLLSDEINDVFNNILNENWKEIWADMGGPAMQLVVKKMIEILNKVFSHIPLTEIYTE